MSCLSKNKYRQKTDCKHFEKYQQKNGDTPLKAGHSLNYISIFG